MTDSSARAPFPGGYWAVPAFLEYVQPPLTPEAIAAAEEQLGVTLPRAYLDLLQRQNGGYLRGSVGVAERLYGIGPQYPSITRDQAWWRPKNGKPENWAPVQPELLIPFDGDGHWNMCFDFRKCGPAGEPSVTLVHGEGEREEAVADSFRDYLAKLVDRTDEGDTRLYGDVTPETVARKLSQHLGAPEPDVDEFAQGYPIWRLSLPGESEWCWCSPNRVPAGFRRDGEDIIATPETALRHPDDPDCVVLLSCTDDSKATVSAALSALKLTTR